jgi:hypothetical protein
LAFIFSLLLSDSVLAYVWFTLAASSTATVSRPQDVEARRLAA